MADSLIRATKARQMYGVERTTWYKLLREGLLPTPIQIKGVRGVFYSFNEMQELIERQKAARNITIEQGIELPVN
jgi:predicted DNA-binding transcriptional regulator AlpA